MPYPPDVLIKAMLGTERDDISTIDISSWEDSTRKTIKLTPLAPSTVRARSSSPEYESTDSDNPTAKKRRKRKRAKPKRDPTPEWLEITVAAKERANSRSVTREGSSAQAQTM